MESKVFVDLLAEASQDPDELAELAEELAALAKDHGWAGSLRLKALHMRRQLLAPKPVAAPVQPKAASPARTAPPRRRTASPAAEFAEAVAASTRREVAPIPAPVAPDKDVPISPAVELSAPVVAAPSVMPEQPVDVVPIAPAPAPAPAPTLVPASAPAPTLVPASAPAPTPVSNPVPITAQPDRPNLLAPFNLPLPGVGPMPLDQLRMKLADFDRLQQALRLVADHLAQGASEAEAGGFIVWMAQRFRCEYQGRSNWPLNAARELLPDLTGERLSQLCALGLRYWNLPAFEAEGAASPAASLPYYAGFPDQAVQPAHFVWLRAALGQLLGMWLAAGGLEPLDTLVLASGQLGWLSDDWRTVEFQSAAVRLTSRLGALRRSADAAAIAPADVIHWLDEVHSGWRGSLPMRDGELAHELVDELLMMGAVDQRERRRWSLGAMLSERAALAA